MCRRIFDLDIEIESMEVLPRQRSPNSNQRKGKMSDPNNDNHADQLNPNNDEYWHSRGEDGRPDDWEERTE